jgi:pilus assembly protein CpaF
MFGKKKLDEVLPATKVEPSISTEAPAQKLPPQQPAAAQPAPAAPTGFGQQKAAPAAAPEPAPVSVKQEAGDFFIPSHHDVRDKLIYTDSKLETDAYKRAKNAVFEVLIEKFNFNLINSLSKEVQIEKINQATIKIVNDLSLPLNMQQMDLLRAQIVDDVRGFGPLEKIMNDPDVSDIMINTANRVFVEKHGKIYITDLTFASEQHLINIIQKIVSQVGRRVDESSPMVDARMPDGSRFNAIIPPLAIDGALVSIRKFKKNKMELDDYVKMGSMSQNMATYLKICAASRLSILVSGGTGSGKTTLLNALSKYIDPGERVITIEDAAELQLVQPHVLRLESRPANMEGVGAISQRALLKNALRMRPDRIILGEIRGEEVIDVLQAMNTGHEGSMATIHSNNPRDCLTRVENLFGLAGVNLPIGALRQQIASSIDMVVQVARMRDGVRRVTSITEITGTDRDIIMTQEIFSFESGQMGDDGKLKGRYKSEKLRPKAATQIDYFGLTKEMERALEINSQ